MERKKGLELEHIFSHFLTSCRFQHAFSFSTSFQKTSWESFLNARDRLDVELRFASVASASQRWHSGVDEKRGTGDERD